MIALLLDAKASLDTQCAVGKAPPSTTEQRRASKDMVSTAREASVAIGGSHRPGASGFSGGGSAGCADATTAFAACANWSMLDVCNQAAGASSAAAALTAAVAMPTQRRALQAMALERPSSSAHPRIGRQPKAPSIFSQQPTTAPTEMSNNTSCGTPDSRCASSAGAYRGRNGSAGAAGARLQPALHWCDLALFKLAPRLQIALREGL